MNSSAHNFAAVAAAHPHPLIYRKIYRDFRRVLLARFPYVLYFLLERDAVVIFLLIHGARDPALTHRLLRERRKTPD